MQKIKTIIIGLGNIGLEYDINYKNNIILTHSRAAHCNKNFNLISAIDNKVNKRNLFEKKYNKETFKNIDDFYKSKLNSNIDLVVISTPPEQHFINIKETLIKIRPKVILCEKPLGINLSDSKKINSLFKKKNCKLFVNYTRLTDIQTKIIIKKLSSKNIANVLYSKSILKNGSHFINLFRRLLGKFKKTDINKNKINIFFKKGILNIKKTQDKNDANTYILRNEKYLISIGRNFFKIFNLKKKLILKRRIDKKNNYYVFKEIFKFFKYKNSKLCSAREAIETQKIIKKILNKKND